MSFTLSENLWSPQRRTLERIIHELTEGASRAICVQSPTGSGKCLAPETPVMLHSGRVVRADMVSVGDELMGPDSKPRKVLSTCRGHGDMYQVTPVKGDPYVVNDVHILTLKMNCDVGKHKKGDLVDISVQDYLAESKTFRHCAKGYRFAVDFPEQTPPLVSPYVLGVWLGDGSRNSSFSFTISDEDFDDIVPELRKEAEECEASLVFREERGACKSVTITDGVRGTINKFADDMETLGLGRLKFVPERYLYGSRAVRLDVLAGLIDTDGYLSGSGFDWISKDKQLAEDLVFLCRSVGLAAYMKPCQKGIKATGFVGNYFRVSISGDCDIIPCRTRKASPPRRINKDVRSVGIKVRPVGRGEYAGFELDGDGRFLLGDFTVTHNTKMAMELFRWADHMGIGGNFYVNRKLLIQQTYDQMQSAGLWAGARAAEYDDLYDEDAPFQVTSAQSEDARVYKSGKWDLHHVGEDGIVIVDEAHMQKSGVMNKIVDWYKRQGARIVLLSATPVNMKGWADHLIVSGTIKEWRDVGALVPVQPTTVSQPDLRKIKRNATGEYVLDGQKKKVFTQSIVGDVIASYEELHETGPTMVYCPGVEESKWMVKRFADRGHRFVHVDATSAIIDGEKQSLTRELWAEIVEMVKDGSVAGLSSRFKLREGIDIPSASHCILATPIGSLASYLQIVGRVMRAFMDPETGYVKTHAVLQDHGGVYHSLGSPNHDREWESLWQLKEHAASSFLKDQMREGSEREPIRCPKCGAERARGPKCWKCGFEHAKSERRILQEDGTMRTVTGDLVQRVVRTKRHNTESLWTQMFYGYRNKKVEQSFAQMEAFFLRTHGYRPTRDMPFMPRYGIDWKSKVYEVPMERLTGIGKDKVS